jgi:hypothetical protein
MLKTGGIILFAVPDCTYAVEHGDLAMLAHEHVSYFDAKSLEALASWSGAEVLSVEKARDAGALYVAWRNGQYRGVLPDTTRMLAFREQAERNLNTLRERLSILKRAKKTLGVYCPGRFLNYHSLLCDAMPITRYFDDMEGLEGKFFPPFCIPVENQDQLEASPPDCLLIMSRTYGSQIAERLSSLSSLKRLDIIKVEDII